MKKILFILLCLPLMTLAQQTYVPDDFFEAYLEANGMGDGIGFNDSVLTSNINTVTYLDVSNKFIADITGIEDFTALASLECESNQLTTLDISNIVSLTQLDCDGNQLTSLDVSQNTALTTLFCSNNQLTNLDVSNNTALTHLSLSTNQLTTLDVSQNTALTSLYCSYNQLISLDLRNGYNININYFTSTNNSNLYCIDVDNITIATALFTNIDPWTSFSLNCPPVVLGCTDSLACNYDPTATIDDSSCSYLTATISTTDVSCNGGNNGTATITATGGCAPYTYLWSPNGQTTSPSTGLTAGTYTGTVIDCNGCSFTTSFTITEPVVLTAIVTTTDVTCNGYCDGTATITATGGCAPYTYMWATGQTGQTLTGLCAGTYTGTVADCNGCVLTISPVTITEPLPLISYDTLSVTTSILWNGMTLTVSGDYSFTLTNSVGCDSIVNLNLTINATGILNITNTEKTLLKVTDVLGRETPYKKRTPLFYIYDDGTVEKRIVIE